MTSPHFARLATELLADAQDDGARVPPPSPEARLRAISAIEQAIVARQRQRRRSRWVGVVAAAAAVVVCGVGVAKLVTDLRAPTPVAVASPGVSMPVLAFTPVLHSTGSVVVANADDTLAAVPDGTPIARGKRLVARPLGHATLAFATGTELTLEERSDLTIDEGGASQRFSLAGGAVSAHVAKLAPGQRFVVATPDAEVEVHGTTFRVAVVPSDPSCGGGTATRVDVLEGVVVVRSRGGETSVTAGERWPAGCTQTASYTTTPPVLTIDKKAAPATSVTPSSQLTEQNDLFAEAVAAKRRGATGQALATFERFLAKYPGSPLAESAMAERMRLLRGSDRGRAAAKQYLARFPGGFARADAQAILAEGQ